MLSHPEFKQKQIVFAFLDHKEKVSFSNDNIIIRDEKGIKHQSTCYRLFSVFLVGYASITSGLLERSSRFGFSIYLLKPNFRPIGVWNAKTEGNVLLRQKQYNYNDLAIARHLVMNKIDSQISLLKQQRKKSDDLKEAIVKLKEQKIRIQESQPELHQLLGAEGLCSKLYFQQIFIDWKWQRRLPRAKQDITNFLMDIGYTMLFNLVECLLNLYGFDTYKGVYHQIFYQRKSLVCDLVEPFRVLIDKKIHKAYRLKQIHAEDFNLHQNQYQMKYTARQHYSQLLLEALLERREEIFLFVQSYYRAFMRNKPIDEYPYFIM